MKKQEEKSNKKEETLIVFYNLAVVDKMDVAGEPAFLRSLKTARGAIDVQLLLIKKVIVGRVHHFSLNTIYHLNVVSTFPLLTGEG